jgi:hypothetical protein
MNFDGYRGSLNSDGSVPVTMIDVPSGVHVVTAPFAAAQDGTLIKQGAGTLTLQNVRAADLSVNGGTVRVAPNGTNSGVSVVGALSIAGGATPSAKLDLVNNAAIINYNGASPVATIRQLVLAGRGGSALGKTWNGQGITSNAAAAAEAESRSIGYAENASLPLGPYATFRGQQVDNSSILMAFTRTGDANLDGIVNDDDVTIVAASYGPSTPQPSWALGDFDYNGFVDDDDVTLLGAFYDPSAAPLLATPTQSATVVLSVPEPSTIVLLTSMSVALGLLCAQSRRRMTA